MLRQTGAVREAVAALVDDDKLWVDLASEAHAESSRTSAERFRLVAAIFLQNVWSPAGSVAMSLANVRWALFGFAALGLDIRAGLASLRNWHAERALEWPADHGQLALVVKSLAKAVARNPDGTERENPEGSVLLAQLARQAFAHARPAAQAQVAAGSARRLGVSVEMLTAWMSRDMASAPRAEFERWVRDSAALLLGWRLMWRGGELRSLRLTDVVFNESRTRCTVTKVFHKTSVDGRSKLSVPMEQVQDGRDDGLLRLCPVRAVRRWLVLRERWAARWTQGQDRGWFFCSEDGKQLSVKFANDLVKELARVAGRRREEFGGHSLRIGGATAMYASGAIPADIRLVGGWRSDAIMRYLRVENAVSAGLTEQMLGVQDGGMVRQRRRTRSGGAGQTEDDD